MKNQQGEVIGFEKLNYTISANTNLKISLETAIAELVGRIYERTFCVSMGIMLDE